MIDFLPERIYNAIKDDQEYENILMYRENEFRKLITFKDFCLITSLSKTKLNGNTLLGLYRT